MNNIVTLEKSDSSFNILSCFQNILCELESVMGEKAVTSNLIRAGRVRGSEIINNIKLTRTNQPISEWSTIVSRALSNEGVCIRKIEDIENDGPIYRVYLGNVLYSSENKQTSARLHTFTYGVIHGALEQTIGCQMINEKNESTTIDGEWDILEFRIK